MPSERVQRQIDRLLDQCEDAISNRAWAVAQELAESVLRLDPGNEDALAYLAAAQPAARSPSAAPSEPEPAAESPPLPTSFGGGRYLVRRALGEGARKRVYLAHDARLDRDVAFSLLKTEELDAEGLLRLRREAQAMGRLGDHPHIVAVHDIGDEQSQPYLVSQYMAGGDLAGVLAAATEHRVSIEQAVRIGDEVGQALEYAHSHGVIHRDLKPGNVWLTADGTAKLGDFGLAIALDRSRLTQAGMMVGTVVYMAPEQALGGEVTARSDLYALGAMLYELVTGRPPFVGDESVAIITQHLNTPPVAPSWHRPDCPPGLEVLILRLLEKDPARRPASAAEVRQALAAVGSSSPRESPPLPNAPPPGPGGREPALGARGETPEGLSLSPNPLYRRVFVGRETEQRQLQAAFDTVLSGVGALVAVVGEPGIGKTALCEQLATYAAVRGGRVLVSHCYEEGSLSLPYLPFVEAMRGYVRERDPAGLAQDLGSGAGEIARLVSEVRERLRTEGDEGRFQASQSSALSPQSSPSPQSSDPEEERWRLYQAVVGFLRNASTVQPLLIVLEDLHWADRGTLDLLLHLVRQLTGARLLVVGTYRDVEVDRTHPLASALAELRRSSSFARVTLRGLRTPEVQRMLAGIAGQEVPLSLAEAVFRQTEGNPLFVQEVARYLVEEGLLLGAGRPDRAGRGADATAIAMSLPDGLREVIGKRLTRLSAECNRVLALGAVVGRDFGLDTLRRISPLADDALVDALDEAVRVGVLEEEARVGIVRYRFAHAYFRQTLYEELSAPRRIQLHQQVARALEQQYAARPEEHAAELAEHFAHSSDPGDLAKAVAYGRRAAARAMAVNAYGEAVRHLERALEVQEVLDPDDRPQRCDLLLALGEAAAPAGEPRRVYQELMPEAFTLGEGLDDPVRSLRACEIALEAINRYAGVTGHRTSDYRTWAERAVRAAPPTGIGRARADIALSQTGLFTGDYGQRIALHWQAVELARQAGEAEFLWEAAGLLLGRPPHGPEEFERRRALVRELADRPTDRVSVAACGQTLRHVCEYLIAGGDRPAAERCLERVREITARARDARGLLHLPGLEGMLAILDGDLDGAVALAERLAALGEELGSPAAGWLLAARLGSNAFFYLGQSARAVPWYDRVFELAGTGIGGDTLNRDVCAAYAGPGPEVVEALRGHLQASGARAFIPAGLEAAVLVGDRDAAARLLSLLEEYAALPTFVFMDYLSVGRRLGAAAALLGDRQRALVFYETALAAAEGVHHRPEQALIRLEIAELLLGDRLTPILSQPEGEEGRAEARRHLEVAIPELRAMKMQSYLESALHLRGRLMA